MFFNSREAIAAIIGDIVFFFVSSSPSMTSIDLQLKFLYVTSFLLLGQLRDLPHSKK